MPENELDSGGDAACHPACHQPALAASDALIGLDGEPIPYIASEDMLALMRDVVAEETERVGADGIGILGQAVALASSGPKLAALARAQREQIRKLDAVVRAVEWGDAHVFPICPVCQSTPDVGHTEGCSLAAALAGLPPDPSNGAREVRGGPLDGASETPITPVPDIAKAARLTCTSCEGAGKVYRIGGCYVCGNCGGKGWVDPAQSNTVADQIRRAASAKAAHDGSIDQAAKTFVAADEAWLEAENIAAGASAPPYAVEAVRRASAARDDAMAALRKAVTP